MRRQRRDRWGDERVIEFLAPFLALEANKFGAIYCPNRPIEIDQQQKKTRRYENGEWSDPETMRIVFFELSPIRAHIKPGMNVTLSQHTHTRSTYKTPCTIRTGPPHWCVPTRNAHTRRHKYKTKITLILFDYKPCTGVHAGVQPHRLCSRVYNFCIHTHRDAVRHPAACPPHTHTHTCTRAQWMLLRSLCTLWAPPYIRVRQACVRSRGTHAAAAAGTRLRQQRPQKHSTHGPTEWPQTRLSCPTTVLGARFTPTAPTPLLRDLVSMRERDRARASGQSHMAS